MMFQRQTRRAFTRIGFFVARKDKITHELMDDRSRSPCGHLVWDAAGAGGYYIDYRLGNNSNDMLF
ncbi:MAG: hypothetical protein KatS3mg099_080 [Candidatus Parcubacteria bacterium]|nr:MAG: hypothetical protein KatS3mg099_080 [Candidatus Parcubacteria bacterium]